MHDPRIIRAIEALIVATAVAVFAAAALVHLDAPGLSNEEAVTALVVEDYLARIRGDAPIRGPADLLPPSLNPFEGSTLPALLTAVQIVFGRSVFVFRALHPVLAICTLLVVYVTVRTAFGRPHAVFSVVLLACSTTLLRAARFGDQRDELLQILLFWLGLMLLQRFGDRGRLGWLAAAGLVWGLALNAKILAVGYLGGAAVAALVLRTRLLPLARAADVGWVRSALCIGAAFAAGAAPYVAPLLLRPARLGGLAGPLLVTGPAHGGWDNRDLLANAWTRAGHVADLLASEVAADLVPTPSNPWFPWLVIAALLGLTALGLRGRLSARAASCLLFIGITHGVLVLTMMVSPSGHGDAFYVLALLPVPQLAVGLAAGELATARPRRHVGTAVAVALLVPALALEVRIGATYLRAIRDGTIGGEYSPAVYRVAEELDRLETRRLYSLSEFMAYNLVYLSEGRVSLPVTAPWPKPVGGDEGNPDPAADAEVHSTAMLHHADFLALTDDQRRTTLLLARDTPRPRRDLPWSMALVEMRRLLAEDAWQLDRVEHIRTADPDQTYALYRLLPVPPPSPPPDVPQLLPDQ